MTIAAKISSAAPRLGAHMSVAGGLERALLRGRESGCEVIQIFSKNSNQWKAKLLSDEDVRAFESARKETGVFPAMVHASYLINLASPRPEEWQKSVDAFAVETERAEALGIPYLVVHPGAHLSSGEDAGAAQAARALNLLHHRMIGYRLKVLLEVTAGQGSCIGHRFEQIGLILDQVKEADRVGVCFDTCHVFAAGYDIRRPEGYEETMFALDRAVGLDRVLAFHLNDCKKSLGCRVDRHEHIGKGGIGLAAFECLVNDPRFFGLPMVLETPKGPDLKEDIENLDTLRRLFRAAPPAR
jgi:deoxyribonuclease-4